MTPRQAAAIIGCSPQQVRTLIRSGQITAVCIDTPSGPCYCIEQTEAERYRDTPQPKGWPRGQSRNNS